MVSYPILASSTELRDETIRYETTRREYKEGKRSVVSAKSPSLRLKKSREDGMIEWRDGERLTVDDKRILQLSRLQVREHWSVSRSSIY
jgi:hypothetical protein